MGAYTHELGRAKTRHEPSEGSQAKHGRCESQTEEGRVQIAFAEQVGTRDHAGRQQQEKIPSNAEREERQSAGKDEGGRDQCGQKNGVKRQRPLSGRMEFR